MSSPAGPDDPDASVDKAELDRLRTELEQLKAEQQTEQQAAAAERRGWWRPVVAGVLVTLVAVLAPLSVLATWANGQIQETDRYIETVGPLADDPDVQDAIAARIEQIVFSYLDIEAVTDELVSAIVDRGLPERAAITLQAAVGPLVAGIQGFVSDKIHDFVRSDAFADAWVQANREAHSQLVAALTGEGDAVTIEDGEVTVGLATIIGTVKTQLVEAGFGIAERIPEVDATFTIVKSDDLSTMQKLLGFLDGLSTWLPVVGLLLLALAVFVARDRRRVLFAAGMAVAGAMLLLGLALNVIRPFYLDALPPESSEAAAGAVSFIRFALRGLLIVALAVAIGAWLSSPSGTGAATRRGIVRAIDAVRSGGAKAGLDTGAFGVSLARYRGPIRVGILVVAALIYLAIDHPTTASALTVVIITAVLLVVLELLAHAPEQETAASPTAGDPP
jgi:hypothetical protein